MDNQPQAARRRRRSEIKDNESSASVLSSEDEATVLTREEGTGHAPAANSGTNKPGGTAANPEKEKRGAAVNPNIGGSARDIAAAESKSGQKIPRAFFSPAPAVKKSGTEGNQIAAGTELFGKYTIREKLRVRSGEADLYLADYGEKRFVAKVYRRASSIKPEVVQKLLAIQSPYVARIFDMGDYRGHTVEVIPYYQQGTLHGKKYSFEDLKGWIIPSLNEGLKAIHDQGIIHKDLKPSNIMLNDNRRSVSIIDFGISSVKDVNETHIVTQTGRTPVYSAPETISNLFLAESDYYSLGVTIFELYTGTLPYAGFTDEQRMRMFALQKIPCPADMPEALKQLIWGLTYADLSNRNNRKNPNRRWKYEEVVRWGRGERQITPGDTASAAARERPYPFKGQSYTDTLDLVLAFNQNWEDGKQQLFRGITRGYFEIIDQSKATWCAEAEDEADREPEREDIIFFRALYRICPEMKHLIWKGRAFTDIMDFGKELLTGLRNGDASMEAYTQDLLENGILSAYLGIVQPNAKAQQNTLEKIENGFPAVRNNEHQKLMLFYRLGYLVSGDKTLVVGDLSFKSTEHLAAYIATIVNRPKEFNLFFGKLINDHNELDPQFESWLDRLGKRNEVLTWSANL